jgi:hypothetical protein
MMLATWLVEIYLSKCNTLEDIVAAESATSDVESLTIERQMMEDDLRNFMTTYKVCPLHGLRVETDEPERSRPQSCV